MRPKAKCAQEFVWPRMNSYANSMHDGTDSRQSVANLRGWLWAADGNDPPRVGYSGLEKLLAVLPNWALHVQAGASDRQKCCIGRNVVRVLQARCKGRSILRPEATTAALQSTTLRWD